MSNIYLELTNRFNEGKLRAVLSSGQAIVVHGLALSSKDGDWIIRQDTEWTRNWTQLKTQIAGLPLRQAHQIVVERAQILPQQVL